MKIYLKNGNQVKQVKVGFSWTNLFFPMWVQLFQGEWLASLAVTGIVWGSIAINIMTGFPTYLGACILLGAMYNKWRVEHLIKAGWTPANDIDADVLKSKGIEF